MLVCVDGTGPSDDAEYRVVFANSFVNRVKLAHWRAHPGPDSTPIHHRGPGDTLESEEGYVGTFGGQHHVDPQFVVDEILAAQRRLSERVDDIPSVALRQHVQTWPEEDLDALHDIGERRRILMVGHSRGGAIVIHAARLLRRASRHVDAMFLFDAVSRNPALDAEVIPDNVRYCYHAMRHPRSRSRISFGHCGTGKEPGVHFHPRWFMTTHGGMGGTPLGGGLPACPAQTSTPPVGVRIRSMISEPACLTAHGTIHEAYEHEASDITPAQEEAGMREVEAWMWPWLRRHGVFP